MNKLNSRFDKVLEQIRSWEEKYQRPKNSVKLLAVSKKKPVAEIENLYNCGQRDFAENYLQEALVKISSIAKNDLCWHFIGPIQSNKTRQIAEHFSWVHSIDRLKIAQRLADARPDHLAPLNLCIQINISNEATKSGISMTEVDELAADVMQLPKLKLRGLMGMPEPSSSIENQRIQCRMLYDCYKNLQNKGFELDTLSMGTTNDMEAAIAEGSTMVRIGTALFGARDY